MLKDGREKLSTINTLSNILLDYLNGNVDEATMDRIYYAQTTNEDCDYKCVVETLYKWGGFDVWKLK